MRRRYGLAGRVFDTANYVLLALLVFLTLYPFWYVLIQSFNVGMDASLGGIYWWPRKLTLENFQVLATNGDILRAYGITIARTILGTAGGILFTAAVAFGVTRRELIGRTPVIIFLFITMLFNGGLIPYYLLLSNLRLLNRFWVYVIPGLFSVWNMVVMKTSFQSIPEEMIESAMVDGANYLRIFWQIVLPVSKPMIAALSLFLAVGHWNSYFDGVFFVSNPKLIPLQTYLLRALTNISSISSAQQAMGTSLSGAVFGSGINAVRMQVTPKSLQMAMLVVTIMPIMLVYPFVQKYFVKGVMIGSIKG